MIKKMMMASFSLCFLISILFIFCYLHIGETNTPSYLSDDTKLFTFICPKANSGYWSNAAYGMKKQDQLQNTNTKFIGPTQYTEEEMSAAIYSAVNSDTNGIITVGSRTDSKVVSALKAAANKNIPVILIDTDSDKIDRLCYIGTNNYEAGRLAGKDITASISTPLHVAVILVSLDSSNQAERLRGFKDELSNYSGCEIATVIEANSSFMYLNEILPRTLEENPDINAIFCAEEYSSTIVGRILDSMGSKYNDVRVVAFDKMTDTLDYVKSGRYYSTIVQQSDRMGELAVKLLNDYQNGVLPQKDIIYTESLSIRKDNLDEVKKYESEGIIWHSYNKNIQ